MKDKVPYHWFNDVKLSLCDQDETRMSFSYWQLPAVFVTVGRHVYRIEVKTENDRKKEVREQTNSSKWWNWTNWLMEAKAKRKRCYDLLLIKRIVQSVLSIICCLIFPVALVRRRTRCTFSFITEISKETVLCEKSERGGLKLYSSLFFLQALQCTSFILTVTM